MKNWLQQSKLRYKDRAFVTAILFALGALAISMVVNFYAAAYATHVASSAVTDIILDNIPVFDVDGLFVVGTFVVILFSAFVLVWKPQKVPFALKSLALFMIIRSVFIVLTHIGPFPIQTARTSYDFLNRALFGADQFFSGHTGMPFLGALVFWDDRRIRYVYLASTIYFVVVVILGHLHYSIDVLSAFFITYSIFHLALYFFKKDRELFFS